MQDTYGARSLRERVSMTVWATDPTTLVAVLAEIEEAGVNHIWVPFGPPWSPDLLTMLAAAAARTAHLKLGTAIVPVYSRHPVLLALQALSLSQLAPQRLRLGLGIGTPAFLLISWSEVGATAYDAAHDAFMTFPPYTCTREGEVRQLGSGPKPCRLGP